MWSKEDLRSIINRSFALFLMMGVFSYICAGCGGDKGDSRLGDSSGVCLFLVGKIAKGMGTECSSDHGVQVVFASMSHLRTEQNL